MGSIQRHRLALWLGTAATLALAGAAHAETAAGTAAVTALPELVVTAERRTENLQKVPISATVLGADQLQKQGVNRVADLQAVSPSLAINTVGRSTFINIRGVGLAQTAPTSTPGVAVYINGALLPHEQIIAGSFYDIEAVEVLRGPQGTLSGQNSTAGAIYMRTPKPRFEELSGYIDQTLGDHNWRRTIAAANVPLYGEMAALRIAGVRDQRDSYTNNIGGPAHPGDVNYTGYRADLRLKPLERLEADLRYEHFLSDTGFNAVKNRADKVTSDPFTIEEDALGNSHINGHRADIEVNYDLTDAMRLRWVSSEQNSTVTDLSDGDRSATALPRPPASNTGRLAYTYTGIKTLTHEVNLLSTGDGPVQWVVGVFYMRDKLPVVLYTYNNDVITRAHPPTSTTGIVTHNRSESVFGQVSWRIDPQWQIVAGARYSKDRQEFDKFAGVPAGVGIETSKVPTGRVALNYNPTTNTLLYASVARGYKSGGNNLFPGDPPYRPEINVVEELGAKTTLLDGHLRLNGDVFASQYKDLQLQTLTPTRFPSTQNVGKSKIYGAELEGMGAWGDLRLNFGLAYLNAKTDVDANLLDGTVSPSVLRLVTSGARLPFSPEWTANAGIEYDLHLAGTTLTPRLQWSHTDTQYASIFQSSTSIIPKHDLLDARLTWAPTERWSLEGFVTNLTDKTYVASQFFGSSSADGGTIYGARRQVGMRVKVNLGGPN
ncbi:TonB-dependent receptor [Phenylobacterium soli]|uniref:TonB-dependent receptor n=1 Tax=Phenylobacterium soli TaxID=2170551 RepID=A0A328AAL9_9CAUL|nr:TonB-dependent receptor [Phenylobacterium soli]RAK51793.1 TonB-dependent receptor [Phenylobacterium soli]